MSFVKVIGMFIAALAAFIRVYAICITKYLRPTFSSKYIPFTNIRNFHVGVMDSGQSFGELKKRYGGVQKVYKTVLNGAPDMAKEPLQFCSFLAGKSNLNLNENYLRTRFGFPLLELNMCEQWAKAVASRYPLDGSLACGDLKRDAFLAPGSAVTIVRTENFRKMAERAGMSGESANDLGLSALLKGSDRAVRVVELDTDHIGVVQADHGLLNKL